MENEKKIEEQFASLSLNEKIASLFKMEVATISEAITYIVKEPMKVAEKLGEMFTEFGSRVESEFRQATKGADEPERTEKKRSGKKSGDSSSTSDKPGSV